MGRILRKKSHKSKNPDGFDSYFYTLLSQDTVEMYFSEKRRRYLVAQGYEYHVRTIVVMSCVPSNVPSVGCPLSAACLPRSLALPGDS